tara:strand:- start:7405 stop:9000 length:1596 start_codon:yes stop_codon:yes gene_type:complete
MAKFIDKKEQVYDLKLTSYGNYLFSIGTFKPVYYAFLDDNVIYDKQYAMARHASAVYTQINYNDDSLKTKSIILKDSDSNSHTMTFIAPGSVYDNPDPATTSTKIVVTDLTTSYDIAVQVSRAIKSASSEGLINITAGEPQGGRLRCDGCGITDVGEGDLYAATDLTASIGLTSVAYGTVGNGPGGCSGSGTTFTGGSAPAPYASMSAFVGGFDPAIERQNEIHKRIKDDTQYLESFVLFRDVESGSAAQQIQGDWSATEATMTEEGAEYYKAFGYTSYFAGDVTPNMMIPEPDVFKFNGIIGDAYLDGDANVAPSWKVVALEGLISSSAPEDTANNQKIPQINIELNYTLDVEESTFNYNPGTIRNVIDRTATFADNHLVSLNSDDFMIYLEEVNTEILTENFEMEVFKILTGSSDDVYDTLERKYFRKVSNQIVNGFMRSETPSSAGAQIGSWQDSLAGEQLDSDSVEYYFDVLVDNKVNQETACKGAEDFNRQSYYVDIDFDCVGTTGDEAIYYDIYGTAVEPEICLD